MIKKEPLVSVIIPTYNSRKTIEKCLNSIKKQSYSNIEIIVVDALSYDKKEKKICKNIIKKFANYFEDGPERSIQRNRGIKESKGKYLLIADQDMYLTEDVVSEAVQTMETKKHVALLIPEISIGDGFWTRCVAFERYLSVYLETSSNECVRFFKKSDAIKINMYDPSIVGAEDSDFHYKIIQLGSIAKIKNHIYHDEGITSFWGRVSKKYYYSKAFREYLKRYPNIAPKQFSPFKIVYFKHWQLILKNPFISLGMFTLRGAEVFAGLLGILFNR